MGSAQAGELAEHAPCGSVVNRDQKAINTRHFYSPTLARIVQNGNRSVLVRTHARR